MTRRRRAAFLDRDGVLNERPPEHDYLRTPDRFKWLPGAALAVASLQREGYVPIVVSNQRGVARGLVSWETLSAIECRIQAGVGAHGGRIAAFLYCPHDLGDRCGCRKPAPGLLLAAAREHRLDLAASVMVGDSETDVDAGRAAGCRTVRIGPTTSDTKAQILAPTLAAAVVALVS